MNLKEKEYWHRVNKAIDYIEKHYQDDLSLELLARQANFSKYHFHRIFYTIMGETLFEFILRIRLEKAASRLFLNKDLPISDVAYDCGFSSPSVFARAFKDFFGVNATEWRRSGDDITDNSNLSKAKANKSKLDSKLWQLNESTTSYFCDVNNRSIIIWSCKMLNTTDLKVTVKDYEPFDVVYLRHIGPYKGDESLFERLFGQICAWAGPRGLIIPEKTKFLSVYYDDPEITDETKLRLDVCLSIPSAAKVEPPFGKMTIDGGKYAVCEFDLASNEYPEAWNFIYGQWLPKSGFQPDDKPCFENYLTSPNDHPEGRCKVEIFIPVKPM